MAKKTARAKATGRKGQKRTPSNRRKGPGARAAARSGAGKNRAAKARRNTGRKTAGAKTPRGKAARKRAANPPRPGKVAKAAATVAKQQPAPPQRATTGVKGPSADRRRDLENAHMRAKAGGTGREETLAQTPAAGRSVKGPTNPMPTKRSTGTAAGAGNTRRVPGLERARRQLREIEETVPTPPSSLDMDRHATAARTGRAEMREARREHTETSPVLTGGDVDADWQEAYAVGDEAPGGDNPTPDQDRVDDIGKALGIEYQDNEELRPADKVADRDKKRWELDPASSDDYRERD
jgi:hypothetical protein